MGKIAYMVIATLPSASMVEEYIAWLKGGHVAEVVAGGAESGEVARLDEDGAGDPRRVLSRYVFASRRDYERYVRDEAPRLRAEGLARFGPERGITFSRFLGEVVG